VFDLCVVAFGSPIKSQLGRSQRFNLLKHRESD
jgi:hypothetical protein